MTDSFSIKRGDTSPAIRRYLTDGDGEPLPLSGATVVFSMARNGTVAVRRKPCIVGTGDDLGYVTYPWAAGDTATEGVYDAEFEITYADGAVETAPNGGFITVTVTRDIA